MNVGVCVDCSFPHTRTEFTHTHKHTYTRTHLPFLLTLPHPSPFSSPSLLLSSLPLSVGYIPPPFSLVHCCSQHTHSHPIALTFPFSSSLFLYFPFLFSLTLSLTALPFPLPTLGSHTHRPKPIVAYYFITCPAHLITAILLDRASTISKITPEMKKSLT